MSDDPLGDALRDSRKEAQRAEQQQSDGGGGYRDTGVRLRLGMWLVIALVLLWLILWLALGWHSAVAVIVIVVASPLVAMLLLFLWNGLRGR